MTTAKSVVRGFTIETMSDKLENYMTKVEQYCELRAADIEDLQNGWDEVDVNDEASAEASFIVEDLSTDDVFWVARNRSLIIPEETEDNILTNTHSLEDAAETIVWHIVREDVTDELRDIRHETLGEN